MLHLGQRPGWSGLSFPTYLQDMAMSLARKAFCLTSHSDPRSRVCGEDNMKSLLTVKEGKIIGWCCNCLL